MWRLIFKFKYVNYQSVNFTLKSDIKNYKWIYKVMKQFGQIEFKRLVISRLKANYIFRNVIHCIYMRMLDSTEH